MMAREPSSGVSASSSSSSRSEMLAVLRDAHHALQAENMQLRAQVQRLAQQLERAGISLNNEVVYTGPIVGPSSQPYSLMSATSSPLPPSLMQQRLHSQQQQHQHQQHQQQQQQQQQHPPHPSHPSDEPPSTQQHEPVGPPSASSAPRTTDEMQLAAAGPAQTAQPGEPAHPLARESESSDASAPQPQAAPAPARASAAASEEAGPALRRSRLRQQLSSIIKGKGKEKEGGG
ncbi:hypothetical protein Rhopal_007695-T1 [Rhodotorula paludigena]|uniref:Uncharacterized protein n=1 Tax=Rhodotorula paludigena TaxID=86838 RepID=A0AAV5H054_9BASI|nr:hypothetical protein Rhopal_007695-T1 [Rhodotorula paludigena]